MPSVGNVWATTVVYADNPSYSPNVTLHDSYESGVAFLRSTFRRELRRWADEDGVKVVGESDSELFEVLKRKGRYHVGFTETDYRPMRQMSEAWGRGHQAGWDDCMTTTEREAATPGLYDGEPVCTPNPYDPENC
jgi:hypothetical protein